MEKVNVSIIVPCRNEASTIEREAEKCFQAVKPLTERFEFLVINDASQDGSGEILDRLARKHTEMSVIHHERSKGIASTLTELYDWASQDYVLNFSFNGEWETDDLAKIIKTRDQADIIVGKRQTRHYSFYRAIVSQIYNDFSKAIFGVATYDAGSIKLFPQKALKSARPRSKSRFADAERMILAGKIGYTIKPIPIQNYPGGKQNRFGSGPGAVLKSFIDMIRMWARFYIPSRPR
ncbi:MAG: glycosyltransferase family 2 protein [bacterium]